MNTAPADPPLILFPGMAADARLFGSQLARFPYLSVPPWITPGRRESLRTYASRFARSVDPGVPCVVGGASFGGIVALEAATHLRAVACVLIGSIRSPAELSWRWRLLRPLSLLGAAGVGVAARIGVRLCRRGTARRLGRLARPDAAFVRWAMCAVLRWQPRPLPADLRIFQLHGECDHVLPSGRSRADTIVPGGQHALPLFNPTAVNAYLERVLEWARGLTPYTSPASALADASGW